MNGDRLNEIIIGAPYALNPNGVKTGAAYIIYGSTGESVSIDLSGGEFDETRVKVLCGVEEGDLLGVSVSKAGERFKIENLW